MALSTPGKAPEARNSAESGNKLIVRQPAKLAELGKLLETFDNLNARVSERSSGPAQDWSGGSGAGAGQKGDDDVSPREKAIQAMPVPEIVRQQLEQHIEKEVAKLEKSARALARARKPGSAFHLNELYAKIRKLHSLMGRLVELAEDVLKRLFIKVFIDRQSIL